MIKGSHQTDQRECLRVTLWKWLQLDRDNATWQTLELAITNANREELDCKFPLKFKVINVQCSLDTLERPLPY